MLWTYRPVTPVLIFDKMSDCITLETMRDKLPFCFSLPTRTQLTNGTLRSRLDLEM